MQARSHKLNCLLPEKQGMLSMICNRVIHSRYLSLGQIGTVIKYYHGEHTTNNDYTRLTSMFQLLQNNMCETVHTM